MPRIEVTLNDPNYLMWVGDGAKTELNRGIFSVTNVGNGYFAGNIRGNILRSAIQNPTYGNNVVTTTDQTPTYQRQKVIVATIDYLNVGTGTPPGGTPATTLRLERSTNNGATWTIISSLAITGSVTSVGSDVRISLVGSLTYTDNTTSASQHRYRVSCIGSSGPWPYNLNQGLGFQRLTLVTTEQ